MTIPNRLAAIPAISRDDLVITGPDLTERVGKWATAVPLEMDDKSTAAITVSLVEQETGELLDAMAKFFRRDPKTGIRRLKRWNVLRLHDTNYVLAVMRRTTDGIDLDFYDEASEDLGRYFGPLKWARNRFTRAQGIKGLANEAGVLSYIPEQNTKQPIADLAREDRRDLSESRQENDQSKAVSRKQAKDAGLAALRKAARDGEVTVKGAKPGAIQTQAMADALSVADELDVAPLVRLTMVVAGIGESGFDPRLTDYATHTHKGVFQSNQVPQYDTKQQARYFLQGGHSFHIGGAIGLAKRFPDASPGDLARQTEISNGSSDYYDGFRKEAEKIISAWLPGSGTSGSGTRTGSTDRAHVERFEFSIGARESYWDAIDRFASEVRWRRFAAFNHLVYASDVTLADINPYELDLDEDWIDDPGQWVVSRDEAIDELPITGRLAAIIPPGTAFAVTADDPLYGTWLSRHFKRDLLDEDCRVDLTLTRPATPLPEPASTVKRRTGRDPSDEGVSDATGLRAKIVAEAEKTLSTRTGYHYYWQGTLLTADPMPPQRHPYRSDCSQWTRAIYIKAGAKDPGLNTWEQDSKGRRTNNPKPGDLVLYENHNHVELFIGNGKTIGHGSEPIDYGVPDQFGDGAYHYVTFDFLND